jgi:hypothetical protein
LDTKDPLAKIKSEVVPAMLRDRFEHVDTELDCLKGDRGLGDVSLFICCQHPPILARPT